jgi:hypothetical protein
LLLADSITTCRKRSEEDNAGASKGKEAPSNGKKKGKAPKKKKATPLKKKQKRNEAAPPAKVMRSLRDVLAVG